MKYISRSTIPALAFAIASTVLFAGAAAYADDAMKPADSMKTDAMKPADSMTAEKMMKECMDKAAMETDSMKKDQATKACEATKAN